MNYTDNLDNPEQFKADVKDALNQHSYQAVQDIKQEIANDFLMHQENDDE